MGQMSSEAQSSVSAIIPAYNAAGFLREAIESVLAQRHGSVECIVVDDGSTDGTAAVVDDFGSSVRLIRQDNRGVAAARNRGAAASRASLLAFLDADDRWDPDRLRRGVEALHADPAAEAVLCATRVMDTHMRPLGVIIQQPDVTVEDALMCRTSLVSVSSNLLIRREAFEALGGFDERLSTSADWALNLQLIARGTLVALPEPLVYYRLHEGGMSTDVVRFEEDMLNAYDIVFREHSGGDAIRLRRRAYANLHRMIAGSYFAERRLDKFAAHAVRSVLRHPSTLPYFLGMPVRKLRRRTGGRGPLARR